MKITELAGKKVCILGFGKEGRAALGAVRRFASTAEVTVADKAETIDVGGVHAQLGGEYLKDLGRFDVVIKSPGIPPQPEIDAVKDRVTSGTQIFLDSAAEAEALTIGVTGSKGKSTTSSLIHAILEKEGWNAHLVGNIGRPAIDFLALLGSDAIFVLEMSSYQLMDLTRSPSIAVVTSFFPEHLDYHGSLEAYKDAKKNIARYQKSGDVVFYNAASPGAREIAGAGAGQKIPFSPDDCPVPMSEVKLLGEHNRSNIAAAYKVALHAGATHEVALSAIRSFEGLPHRLQALGMHHGIAWVDDAISTTPESTIAALDALGGAVGTIILGGQDRGYDFTLLGTRLASSTVSTAILFPGSGPRIRLALERAGAAAEIHDASSMEEAVAIAKRKTPKGKTCLLSTASPSYGMFKNFEEKGDAFRRCAVDVKKS